MSGLITSIVVVGIVLMVMGMMAIVSDKTKKNIDAFECSGGYEMNGTICCQNAYPWNTTGCFNCTMNATDDSLCYPTENGTLTEGARSVVSPANNTMDNVMEGTEDGSDMGKILLFALPAIAVLGLFVGLTRLI